MTDTHVVSALKEKSIRIASQIESLQDQLQQAVIDLEHVEAALKLFDPDIDLALLPIRKIAPASYDTKRASGRIILETLRNATQPLSTEQVCQAVMVARRLDTNDKRLCRTMMRRTNANLQHWAKKHGMIRSMPGIGRQLFWEAVL